MTAFYKFFFPHFHRFDGQSRLQRELSRSRSEAMKGFVAVSVARLDGEVRPGEDR